MNTPKKEERTHKTKVRGDIVLKEMDPDSFFDWQLRVRSIFKKKRNRSLFEEALSDVDYETTNNDTQSEHEPPVTCMHNYGTASENIDEEPDENVEDQSACFESDEGEEEV